MGVSETTRTVDGDTIVAVATAPGQAGVGIVRVSGPEARAIGVRIGGSPLPARRACHRTFRDHAGEAIDSGILLYFAAPASFTGEDVVEFQGHGGPVVLSMLTEEILKSGARLARPGEFTERAFLNGQAGSGPGRSRCRSDCRCLSGRGQGGQPFAVGCLFRAGP